MSKKGRTSVVLLSSLVISLLFIPLVYLAYGAKVDRTLLNRRIALLDATEVASPTALQARYRLAREKILPILPPDPGYRFNSHGGIVVFDPANFSWEIGRASCRERV